MFEEIISKIFLKRTGIDFKSNEEYHKQKTKFIWKSIEYQSAGNGNGLYGFEKSNNRLLETR